MKNYNTDLSKRVIIESAKEKFTSTDEKGVSIIPLEHEETSIGRNTAIVKYSIEKEVHSHTYPFGAEIYVIEGEFSDENGTYAKGTYLQYPAGTSHNTSSSKGCKLFVKYNHLKNEHATSVVVNTDEESWLPGYGELKVLPLSDIAALVKWPKGAKFINHSHFGGEEILVLEGEFIDEYGRYPKGTWIRSPHLSMHNPYVEEETIILVKTGHL